jgi:CheY-like chemotaxis protein
VAKILVADDNSNIQRMVGLALKDQGIDVVAVGNGEAAVRKISELRPDLVLADVFMPVRNGYEVCQYVKEDSSLAHIPVILLVGAFDPLDEQEAQRVGADGVLKKPFVPPDPLIAMVKAALQRAGIPLTPGAAEKPAAPSRKGTDLLPQAPPAPAPPAPPPISPLAGISFSTPIAPIVADENFVDQPAPQQPVSMDAAKHTMAFGNLLAPPAKDDAGLAATEEEMVGGSDWRNLEEPADVPEEEEVGESKDSAPSWRRGGADTAFQDDDGVGPVKDWRDSAVVQTAGRRSARETWEQAADKGGFVTAADVPTEMGAFATELSALEAETLTANAQEPKTAETGTGEIHGVQTVESSEQAPAFAGDAGNATLVEKPAPAMASSVEVATAGVAESPTAEIAPKLVAVDAAAGGSSEIPKVGDQEVKPSEVVHQELVQQAEQHGRDERASTGSETDSWFSRPTSPWDAEPLKTDSLASSWDIAKVARAGNGEASPEEAAAVLFDAPATEVLSDPEPRAHSEKASQGTTEVVAKVAPQVDSAADSDQKAAAGSGSGSQTQKEMDELVARVLARLSPEVLHAAAMEMLKPVVSAIIADEVKSKK